jgi:hypothetical protein
MKEATLARAQLYFNMTNPLYKRKQKDIVYTLKYVYFYFTIDY